MITEASVAGAPVSVDAKTFERLESYAREAEGAFSPNTQRALRTDSRHFTLFCAERGATSLPAEPATVIAYVEACIERGHRPATIRRRASSIAHMHRAARLADPTKAEPVKLALRRMARALGTRQRQAKPVGEADVARVLAATARARAFATCATLPCCSPRAICSPAAPSWWPWMSRTSPSGPPPATAQC